MIRTISDFDTSSSEDEDEDDVRVVRVLPNRKDPFTLYDDEEFKLRFRFSKENVILIKNRLRDLEPTTNRNKPLSGTLQLLITLSFYATGSYQKLLGDRTNVSKSTACRVIRRISEKIASLKRDHIYMPRPDEISNVKNEFYGMYKFPGVIGVIDCTHVRIQAPGGANAEVYRNRKGYSSLNIQVVCDAKLVIRNIIARWPGSVHNSTIFNDTPLRADLETNCFGPNTWLLGNSEYACKAYLLTPLVHPVTPSEQAYNRSHISTRNTIERCFGVLKRRFPCLHTGMRNKLETTAIIIVACSVLHNIAIELQDEDDFNEIVIDVEDEAEVNIPPQNETDADTSARTLLIHTRF